MRSYISTVKSGCGKENGGHIRDEQSDGDEAGHKGYFPNPGPGPGHDRSPHPTSNDRKMRQIRSKAYRKLMAMYGTSFGFRQPYQVLGAL